jgi:ribosome-binding protein aMBF1 (putative translation factor)
MMWVEGVRAQPRARRKNTRPHRTRSAGKQVTQTPDPAALARALEHIRTGTGVQLRRQAGLSTAELAAELRIPEPKARHLEQGQLRRPRKAWLQRYDALLRGLAAPQQQDAQVDPQ